MNKLVCLVGVLAFAVCIQCESPDEMNKIFDECVTEVGMSEKPNGPLDLNDQKVKCLYACVMKKSGKIVDGKISLKKELEGLEKHASNVDDAMKAKISECVNTANQQSDECEVAGSIVKCLFGKNGPRLAL